MTIPTKELAKFDGFRFTLREYKTSHSTLVLSAVNLKDASSKFELGFADVHYIKLPASWVGRFEEGTIAERDEIIKRDVKFLEGLIHTPSSSLKLYNVNQDEVLIIGSLMHIESTNLND